MKNNKKKLEILAPAGDLDSLIAALSAGADAVYFGLTSLNARRGASNFYPEQLTEIVKKIHTANAKAYLTLNIYLKDREIGQATRILELARQCKVDAVLVCDPALLYISKYFPELEFHFSTQAAISNSYDVRAARELGIKRVVLARENSLEEIAIASQISGVETEVFIQGALCFCVSGRCLLSSWGGGHSGNRGSCTSPCRVPWGVDEPAKSRTPISMRDLGGIKHLPELKKIGVTAIKIEGRLKKASWVHDAVTLYNDALTNSGKVDLTILQKLGNYTGRKLTDGYFIQDYKKLIGISGRQTTDNCNSESADKEMKITEQTKEFFDFSMEINPRNILCTCQCDGHTQQWTMAKSHVKKKFITVNELLQSVSAGAIQNYYPREVKSNEPEFLLPNRSANKVFDALSSILHKIRKTQKDTTVRSKLTTDVKNAMHKDIPYPNNNRKLGAKPDRVRIQISKAADFVKASKIKSIIVENADAKSLQSLKKRLPTETIIIVALPPVFFENSICKLKALLKVASKLELSVEVNSWGGWILAKEAGVRFTAGAGLAIYNTLAGRQLQNLGFSATTISLEADKQMMEDISKHCPISTSLVVYGRPPLLISRVELPNKFINQPFQDRRGISIIPRKEWNLTVFRPEEAYNIKGQKNPNILVGNLIVDLVAANNPFAEWQLLLNSPHSKPTLQFNYKRILR